MDNIQNVEDMRKYAWELYNQFVEKRKSLDEIWMQEGLSAQYSANDAEFDLIVNLFNKMREMFAQKFGDAEYEKWYQEMRNQEIKNLKIKS